MSLQTKYKHIHFVHVMDKTTTSEWTCNNNSTGDLLGTVKWYSNWRQYVFIPIFLVPTVFSVSCLEDINHFIGQLEAKRKGV